MVKKLSIAKIKGKTILAIGAHPDDLELSAGGTLALLSRNNSVTVLVSTDGGAGNHDLKNSSHQLARQREEEAIKAAKILGSSTVIFFKYPDLQLRQKRQSFFRKLLKYLLSERPQIIITWDYWGKYELYVHPDHRITAEVVMEAVLEATLPSRLRRWAIDGAQPLNPKPQLWLMAPGEPNRIVDITSVYQTKQKALNQHKSQISTIMKYTRLGNGWSSRRRPKYSESFRILET